MSLYSFARKATWLFIHALYNITYEGVEHIPSLGHGYILACNHRSMFDPLFIAHKVPADLRFMGKSELFRNPLVRWLFTRLGAFPIERGTGDFTAMERAAEVIHNGGVFAIFPEGKRSVRGKPLRARSGIGMVAAQTGADVLPVAICYGERLRFRSRVTVRYSELMTGEELGADAGSPSSMRQASKKIMAEIVRMINLDNPAATDEAMLIGADEAEPGQGQAAKTVHMIRPDNQADDVVLTRAEATQVVEIQEQ